MEMHTSCILARPHFLDDERDGIAWLRVEVEIQRSASACHILISIMLLLSQVSSLPFFEVCQSIPSWLKTSVNCSIKTCDSPDASRGDPDPSSLT
jgi:hypothetical protein